ncbi:tyrosine-type recombinase/integrase [Bacillus pretiosus]|uniref:phage lytic cycle repressor MrpR family protein n=1 Tax=Bacillus pretiosus TaxID=2983392 RepID=UPI003D656542
MLKKDTIIDLEKVLEGVKFLSKAKKDIMMQLSEVISEDKVKALFDGELKIDNLNDSEQLNLLTVIYGYAKDERFNPSKISDKEDKKEKEEPKKDNMPNLYFDYSFKKEFASQYKDDTRRVVLALFRKTAEIENSKGKDLYSFNKEELAEAIIALKAKTVRSLQDKVSTIERYIDFAKDNGKTKINYATLFDTREKLEALIDKEADENMIFDKDEIMEMAMSADNAQDGVILGLLFDGLSHKNEFEELTELTKDDINMDTENQEIILEDRNVPISTETAILINRALKQDDVYVSITGEKARKYKIAEGDHVLRGLRGKNKVKGQIISQRLLRIADTFEYPYLNATTISYSGQLHLAKELIEEKGVNINNAIIAVLKRFALPINNSSQFTLKNRIEKYLNLSK